MRIRITRRFVPVAVLGLLVLIAAFGGGSAGTLLFVLFAAALPAVVLVHRRLLRSGRHRQAASVRPTIRTPARLALAVVVVTCVGALAVVLVSVLLAVVASALVADGSGLVRVLLVAFVLGPCLSLGRRCGRWWAFAGAAGLVPLLAFVLLVGGYASSSGIGAAALFLLGTSCALALGSLQAEWETQATTAAVRRPVRPARPSDQARVPSRSRTGQSAIRARASVARTDRRAERRS